MSRGERPIGTAKSKQPNTKALCLGAIHNHLQLHDYRGFCPARTLPATLC